MYINCDSIQLKWSDWILNGAGVIEAEGYPKPKPIAQSQTKPKNEE